MWKNNNTKTNICYVRYIRKYWKKLQVLCLTTLLIAFGKGYVEAQDITTLTVSVSSGTVSMSDPCPVPRNSATYADIQAAVDCAQRGDILALVGGVYPETFIVDKDLTINGAGADESIINANGAGSVVTVANGVTVILTDLTVTGGNADFGGGVFTQAGNIQIINSIITSNTALSAGGGIFTGAGSITILNSSITGNQTSGDGGGIFTRAGTIIIENSTISGHTVTGMGGGLGSGAGSITLTNSTISGNTADGGGGIDSDAGTITLTNATIADNNLGIITVRGVVNLGNTVLADNNNVPCRGILLSTGHNLIETLSNDCTVEGDPTGNIVGLDPLLGVLKNNGGSTETHALLEDSPAINSGDAIACAVTDQRGATRLQGDTCDIGAYEGIRGDCNADLRVDAGDISALSLEIFDEDGSDPISLPGGNFVGDSMGCNANADNLIDAGDIACLVLTIFDGPGSCGIALP